MAIPLPPQLAPKESVRLVAQIKLKDVFGDKYINALDFFSPSIKQYLLDYFILLDDLRTGLNEESRRSYSDYSFLVFPVHKAFESFLIEALKTIFRYDIPNNAPIGVFLNYKEEQKRQKLDELEKLYNKWGISKEKWLTRWNALANQWSDNRNPLTHPAEIEIIPNLSKAEHVASSIIREMDLSVHLFTEEFLDPVYKLVKEREKEKELTLKEEKKERRPV